MKTTLHPSTPVTYPTTPLAPLNSTYTLAENPKPLTGVWFVYGTDMNAYPMAVFADADALAKWLEANGGCGERVTFWPFGVTWSVHTKGAA